jgi:nucleotide-binding universal stress UspA family protein
VAKIVVGIDGSNPSKEALRWALEETRLRSAEVVAVHAWKPPPRHAGRRLARPWRLRWLLLGSVSQQLAHDAPCPLLIHRRA